MLDPTEVDVPQAARDLTEGADADVAFECAVDGGFRQLIDHKEEHVKILVHP